MSWQTFPKHVDPDSCIKCISNNQFKLEYQHEWSADLGNENRPNKKDAIEKIQCFDGDDNRAEFEARKEE